MNCYEVVRNDGVFYYMIAESIDKLHKEDLIFERAENETNSYTVYKVDDELERTANGQVFDPFINDVASQELYNEIGEDLDKAFQEAIKQLSEKNKEDFSNKLFGFGGDLDV